MVHFIPLAVVWSVIHVSTSLAALDLDFRSYPDMHMEEIALHCGGGGKREVVLYLVYG